MGRKIPPRMKDYNPTHVESTLSVFKPFSSRHSRSFSRENTYSTSFHICRPLRFRLKCERVSWESESREMSYREVRDCDGAPGFLF